MVDDGDGMAEGGCDFPAPAEEVDLMVGVAAPAEMEGQVEIEEAQIRSRTHGIAVLGSGLCPSLVWGEACGSAHGAVLTFDLPVEDDLGRVVMGNSLEGQQGDEAVLKSSEAALDLSFSLRARSDQMRNAQRREGPLELGAWITAVGGGLIAKEREAVGVESPSTAMVHEGPPEVFEVAPGGVGGDEGGSEVFAGVVIDGEQKGLLVVGLPPGVDGRVVLPELADGGTLPTPFGLGNGKSLADEIGKVGAGVGGDRFAVAQEGEALGEFVSDELEIGWALEGQKGLQEALNLNRPYFVILPPETRGAKPRGLWSHAKRRRKRWDRLIPRSSAAWVESISPRWNVSMVWRTKSGVRRLAS